MARRFAVEADMLALIAAAAPELAGPGAVAVFEVQSAAGVPDVVAAVFDQDVIAARAGTGFVTDPAGLAALLALSDALGRRRALDARQVAAAAGVTASYVRSRVLPGLAARGLAVMTAPGRWAAAGPYRSPASHAGDDRGQAPGLAPRPGPGRPARRRGRRGLAGPRRGLHQAGRGAGRLVPRDRRRPGRARPGRHPAAPAAALRRRPCSAPAVSSWPSGSPNSTAPARYPARWAGCSGGTWPPLQELIPGRGPRRPAVPGEAVKERREVLRSPSLPAAGAPRGAIFPAGPLGSAPASQTCRGYLHAATLSRANPRSSSLLTVRSGSRPPPGPARPPR